MARRLISTGSPFEKAYGYSRAVVDGGLVFVAGTTGYDYATMTLPEDAASQARNCFKTIADVLVQAGTNIENLVRVQYFVTSRDNVEAVLGVAGEVLSAIRPAASMYIIAGLLNEEMKVEIEATARIPG